MPNRYRFDLQNGQEVIPDETGVVADDLDLAIEAAADVIRDMRASGELLEADDRWELVIRDDDGSELQRFPL